MSSLGTFDFFENFSPLRVLPEGIERKGSEGGSEGIERKGSEGDSEGDSEGIDFFENFPPLRVLPEGMVSDE
jgi:hypothetical protein